jgi:hypothetical protein
MISTSWQRRSTRGVSTGTCAVLCCDPGSWAGGGAVKPPVFVREECINDVDKFAEALNKGGVNRYAVLCCDNFPWGRGR